MAVTRRAGSLAKISNTGTYIPVTIPSTAVVGDIAILSFQYTTSITVSGWTKISTSASIGTRLGLQVFWKVIASGDPGSTVQIGDGNAFTVVSLEVWTGTDPATAPTLTASTSAGVWPSATAPINAVPIYIGTGYTTSTAPPATITPPSGIAGSYATSGGTSTGDWGLGAWYGPATSGTTAPSVTFGFTASTAYLATVVLAPAPTTRNAYIAGSTSANDVLCSIVLAGATAAADTTLLWTP